MGLFNQTEMNAVPKESSQAGVSTYAQPYATNLLEKSNALLNAPTPQYTGEMAAGPSALQNQAFQGLSNLTLPTSLMTAGTNLQDIGAKQQALNYTPTGVTTNTFNAGAAQQYMNPYIQQALDPQLAALTRQHKINQQGDMAKLAQAGAYGGSRQAILQGQGEHNLLAQQAGLIGSGYNQAYNNAATQFNADQARNLQGQQLNQAGKQFAATYDLQGLQAATQANTAAANAGAQQAQYGLQNLTALGTAGGTQQQLAQAQDNAKYNEYLRQLKYPQDIMNMQKGILGALPITTTNTFTPKLSVSQQAAAGISGLAGVAKDLIGAGMMPDAVKAYMKNMFGATDAQAQATLEAQGAQASELLGNVIQAGGQPDGNGNYVIIDNYGNTTTFDGATGQPLSQGNIGDNMGPSSYTQNTDGAGNAVQDVDSGFGPTIDQNYNYSTPTYNKFGEPAQNLTDLSAPASHFNQDGQWVSNVPEGQAGVMGGPGYDDYMSEYFS